MAITNYLEKKLLNHSLGAISYTMPEETYVGLFTTLPTDSVAGVEVVGTGYARQLVTWELPTDTGIRNATHVTFGSAGSSWGLVIGFGVWDTTTTGNLLYYGNINPTADLVAGDTYRLPSGAISLSMD